MSSPRRRFKLSEPLLEWTIAAAVGIGAIALALLEVWVFRRNAHIGTESVWQILLSDRATIGFVRLLLVATALYAIASIAVLIVRRRWLRSISTTGIAADPASNSDEAIKTLKAELGRAVEERDEAYRLLWRSLHG